MKQGTITGISGPVIDVRFPEGSLPAINEALTVEANGQRYTMEVEQHLENKTVRCVMMAGSDGLARRLTVTATGHGIRVPVGEKTLGRMFNVLGDPIDGEPPVDERAPVGDPPRRTDLRRADAPPRIFWRRASRSST